MKHINDAISLTTRFLEYWNDNIDYMEICPKGEK